MFRRHRVRSCGLLRRVGLLSLFFSRSLRRGCCFTSQNSRGSGIGVPSEQLRTGCSMLRALALCRRRGRRQRHLRGRRTSVDPLPLNHTRPHAPSLLDIGRQRNMILLLRRAAAARAQQPRREACGSFPRTRSASIEKQLAETGGNSLLRQARRQSFPKGGKSFPKAAFIASSFPDAAGGGGGGISTWHVRARPCGGEPAIEPAPGRTTLSGSFTFTR